MSLKTPKAVYSSSERKYLVAGGDLQGRWGWYSRVTEVGTNRLKHGLVKQTQFFVSFIAPWWRNGSFQRTQSFQFLNRSLFRSSPVVINLRWRLKEYCQKNKRQRWDICEEFSVWHFVTKNTGLKSVKPGMSSLFSESRDPSYASSAMCPECLRKEWRSKSFRLQTTPTGKRPRSRPRWRDYISDLAWSRLRVQPAELTEIAVDNEVFWVLLGLLPPRLSLKEKLARKWVNEYVGSHCNFLFMKLSLDCLPAVNVVFKKLSIFGRKLRLLWKSVKSIRHGRENGVDTLKLNHDTLLKTLKKHCRSAILPIFLFIFFWYACHVYVIDFFSVPLFPSTFYLSSSSPHPPVNGHASPLCFRGYCFVYVSYLTLIRCILFLLLHVKYLQLKIDLC